MGSIKIIVYLLIILLFLSSCNLLGVNKLFEKGYTDSNGQYIPKNPKFKLKEKPNNHIPNNLDTVNIYKLDKIFTKGKQDYPFLPDDYRYGDSRFDIGIHYLKFYQKGRCLSFALNLNSLNRYLKETDLNPNSTGYSKEYYYSRDGKKVFKESFVSGDSYGMYSTKDFIIIRDTLIFDDKKGSKSIYIKEVLPKEWKNYKANW